MSKEDQIQKIRESNLIPTEVTDQYIRDLEVIIEEQDCEIESIKNNIDQNLSGLTMI